VTAIPTALSQGGCISWTGYCPRRALQATVVLPRTKRVVVKRLGEEYNVCYGFGTEERVRTYNKAYERALVVYLNGVDERLTKSDGRPFSISVLFTPVDSDQTDWDFNPGMKIFADYGIVSAKIR